MPKDKKCLEVQKYFGCGGYLNRFWGYVFTGYASPLHFGVCVSGHFNNVAAVAFLPPPRSPAKTMRELRSPPLLIH